MAPKQAKQAPNPNAGQSVQPNLEYFHGWFVLNAKDGAAGKMNWLKFKPKRESFPVQLLPGINRASGNFSARGCVQPSADEGRKTPC